MQAVCYLYVSRRVGFPGYPARSSPESPDSSSAIHRSRPGIVVAEPCDRFRAGPAAPQADEGSRAAAAHNAADRRALGQALRHDRPSGAAAARASPHSQDACMLLLWPAGGGGGWSAAAPRCCLPRPPGRGCALVSSHAPASGAGPTLRKERRCEALSPTPPRRLWDPTRAPWNALPLAARAQCAPRPGRPLGGGSERHSCAVGSALRRAVVRRPGGVRARRGRGEHARAPGGVVATSRRSSRGEGAPACFRDRHPRCQDVRRAGERNPGCFWASPPRRPSSHAHRCERLVLLVGWTICAHSRGQAERGTYLGPPGD
eukprot:scaffold1386_cov380-Prasinococcus_capsulatus_cf.AAC.2